jgi:hypothetical protein
MATLNLSIALMNPGPSRRLGARAFRIASPIVSVTTGGAGESPLDGGVGNAGAGDWKRDIVGLSRSRESERVPKICRCEGGM